ncbi:formylglycine-generating enzyme family protein [Maritimibacter alkaliphilus]|uniref:formylglycine-generating enzyme family protein n=1 Tax=Maritimibacter alkaliphilus TaxID=404236 RepID=UPI001C946B66|nr:formylglycine-generating enzyme family protein [Maritimibacter alkaliphilus]MBY6090885.1 formylglycine-generating enzyme family protein [Maritimibacter alkaliphilus]
MDSEAAPKACCGGVGQGAGCGAGQGVGDAFEAAALSVPAADAQTRAALRAELKPIPGGIFEMGARQSRYPQDLDSPRRKLRVSPFLMAPTTVTNAQYARFVAQTGYRTVAEAEGWSFVFHLFVADLAAAPVHPAGLPWWRQIEGACWQAPEGPGSDWRERPDHPAIHISWYDALAYATWAGLRLPREAEWERAARGGLARMKFPWGNTLVPAEGHAMNTWQGVFPEENSAEDGHVGPAPVRSFAANGYGLHEMTGNVWEWVQDRFGPLPGRPGARPVLDPQGPGEGEERVQRGGSFLCHESYCDRYHVHSRTRSHPDSSTSNSGFRVAADAC